MTNNYMNSRINVFKKKYLKYVILTLAIALCALGVIMGDVADVFGKAAKICLECCGIG